MYIHTYDSISKFAGFQLWIHFGCQFWMQSLSYHTCQANPVLLTEGRDAFFTASLIAGEASINKRCTGEGSETYNFVDMLGLWFMFILNLESFGCISKAPAISPKYEQSPGFIQHLHRDIVSGAQHGSVSMINTAGTHASVQLQLGMA